MKILLLSLCALRTVAEHRSRNGTCLLQAARGVEQTPIKLEENEAGRGVEQTRIKLEGNEDGDRRSTRESEDRKRSELSSKERKGNCEDHRIAVVSNFAHQKNITWLSDMEVQEVGITSTRQISESLPWIEWIVEHYDRLPDVVVFLHGDRNSWHHESDFNMSYLRTHKPKNVTMLADKNCVWAQDLPNQIAAEHTGLDFLYGAIWGLTFSKAWDQFHMANSYRCCAENIVTKSALTRFSKQVYQELASLMIEHPDEPWAWIMERTWQNLFSAPAIRSDKTILEALRAPWKTSMLQENQLQELIAKMRVGCVDPM